MPGGSVAGDVSPAVGDAVGVELGGGLAVDVRVVDLARDDLVVRAETFLTPGERSRARRGRPAVHRRRVLLRAALRSLVAAELGTDPMSVPLATTPAGRPYVPPAAGRPALDVSCSASGSVGVVAVGRACRVGVDVERVAAWSPGVLDEGWLSRGEQCALRALPPEQRPAAVARAWTQKEAVLKGRGIGLRGDLAATETAVGRVADPIAGWRIRDVPVPEGWVGSLAVTTEDDPDKEMPS